MANEEKTLIRSVRISKALDTLLRKDAKTKRITVNALISSIMTKYAEWDRYNERFGVISIKRDAFRSILGMIEDDKIIRVSKLINSEIDERIEDCLDIHFVLVDIRVEVRDCVLTEAEQNKINP